MIYKQLKEVVEKHNVNQVKLFHNGELLDEWDVGSPEYAEREEWYIVGDDERIMQDPSTMQIVLLITEITQTPEGKTQLDAILDVEVDVAIVQKSTLQTAHKKLKRREIPTFVENAKKSSGLSADDLILVVADWESRKLEIQQPE